MFRLTHKKIKCIMASFAVMLFTQTAFAQPMSGTYTVGASTANYATLSAAIDDLEQRGVSQDVTLSILPGQYLVHDTLPATIAGLSGTNDLIITSSTGNASDVVLYHQGNTSFTNHVLSIEASNVRIQDLTLESKTVLYGNLIKLQDGAMRPSFHNVEFLSVDITKQSEEYTSQQYQLWVMNNSEIDSLHVTECTFRNGSYGIRGVFGGRSFGFTYIDQCEFQNHISGAVNIYNAYPGVHITNSGSYLVDHYVDNTYRAFFISRSDDSLTFMNNIIEVRNPNHTANYEPLQMNNCNNSGRVSGKHWVANNAITVVGYGPIVGLEHVNGDNFEYVHNTFILKSIRNKYRVLGVDLGFGSTPHFQNNNFELEGLPNSTQFFTGSSSSSATYSFSSHNNNFHHNGIRFMYFHKKTYATLQEVRDSLGLDTNSISHPSGLYVSENSLSLCGTPMDSGLFHPKFPVDLMGQTRNTSRPTIGAFEVGLGNQPFIEGKILEDSICEKNYVNLVVDSLSAMVGHMYWIVNGDTTFLNWSDTNSVYFRDTNKFVEVGFEHGACKALDTLDPIVILDEPEFSILSHPPTVCDGDSVIIKAVPTTGNKVYWYSSSSAQTKIDSATTKTFYADRGTQSSVRAYVRPEGEHCNGRMRNISMAIHTPPSNPKVSGDTIVCDGDSIVLSAPITFQDSVIWYADTQRTQRIGFGSDVSFLQGVGTTSYFASVFYRGCESELTEQEAEVIVVPSLNVSRDTSWCENETIGYAASASVGSVFWSSNGQMSDTLFTGGGYAPSPVVGTDTAYVVAIHEMCASDTVMSVYTIEQCETGWDEVNVKASVAVYPNPARQRITAHCAVEGIERIEILNAAGAVVISETNNMPEPSTTIDVSALNRGVYLLKVTTETSESVSRLLLQ